MFLQDGLDALASELRELKGAAVEGGPLHVQDPAGKAAVQGGTAMLTGDMSCQLVATRSACARPRDK